MRYVIVQLTPTDDHDSLSIYNNSLGIHEHLRIRVTPLSNSLGKIAKNFTLSDKLDQFYFHRFRRVELMKVRV